MASLGDVAGVADHKGVVVVFQTIKRGRENAHLAIGKREGGLEVHHRMLARGLPEIGPERLVDGRRPVPDRPADGFGARHPPEALGGLVHVQQGAIFADVEDRLG